MKRVAWTFLCGALCAFGVQAAVQNEWTFESDPPGQSLTNAANAVGTARFYGISTNVYTASASAVGLSAGNRVLLCVGAATNAPGSAWTNGAVLNAALTNTTSTSITSGVHYLRYDVAYSFSTNNNSGTVLGAYFTGAGDRTAGFVLGYNKDDSNLAGTAPARRPITRIAGLATNGSLIAIAEVNLSSNTLKVWYSVDGSVPAYTNPAASKSILLTSISNLCFHATGTFRSPDSTNYAAVDNLRMADSWEDIAAKVPDFSKEPKVEISRVIITTTKGTFTNSTKSVVTAIGETNTVEIVIRSLGSPASNVISSVVAAANPEYFSITSNNTPAAVLLYPQYATNTFSVIIKTNAQDNTNYVFSAGATADGASGVSTNFSLTVGALIVYKTNSITEVTNLFGGAANGRYEPGEILDITVTSENVGVRPVSNIVNSLSANPAYFTITNTNPPSQNYPVLAVDAVTSTTYRVEILAAATHGAHRFSVTNQSDSLFWPGSFQIDVFKQGIPSVFPSNITINLLAGSVTNNSQVVVTNDGNDACTFSITDDGSWGPFYDVTTGALGKTAFVKKYNNVIVLKDPDTSNGYISSTNDGVSSATSLGFNFPFYGTTYSNFYVTADGYIGLVNTTNVPAQSTDRTRPLPATNVASQIIAPFWGTLRSPAGSIRYARNSERLAISFSGVSKEGGSKLAFQVALFTNGCIEFRYATIAGVTNAYGQTNVTIGIQVGTASYTNLAVKPVNGTSVRLTPQRNRWVSYPAQDIGIDRQGSARVPFTVDASGMTAATSTTVRAWFNWSTGGSNAVVVTVNVTALAPVYSAVSSLSFTGTAAQVTSVPFIINNLGTIPLTFTITDPGAATAGYTSTNSGVGFTSTNSVAYKWIDISSTGTKVSLIDPDPANSYITAEDEGFSAMIPLKFTFPFYGGTYTQFCVSVNGALRLDTAGKVPALTDLAVNSSVAPAQMIAPYCGDLLKDANATIKYRSTAEQLVVTWENIQQHGLGGGSNLTFQAVLKPSGEITFQYKRLEGALFWPNTTIGLRDTMTRTSRGDVRQPRVWTVSTNVYGAVSTQYVSAVSGQRSDWIISTNVYGAVSTQYVNAVSNRVIQFQSARSKVIGYTPSSGSIAAGSNAVITITGDASSQSVGTNNISTNTILTITHNVAAGSTNTLSATLSVTFTTTNSLEVAFLRSAAGDAGAGLAAEAGTVAGANPQAAGSAFSPKVEGAPGAISLSWTAPQDGAQRIYTIYSTTDLMSGWDYLAAVTNATTYLDTRTVDVPTIYYKITVTVE